MYTVPALPAAYQGRGAKPVLPRRPSTRMPYRTGGGGPEPSSRRHGAGARSDRQPVKKQRNRHRGNSQRHGQRVRDTVQKAHSQRQRPQQHHRPAKSGTDPSAERRAVDCHRKRDRRHQIDEVVLSGCQGRQRRPYQEQRPDAYVTILRRF